MMMGKINTLAASAALLAVASAQTFRRLGSCPTLGCVLPPDQSDFLPGQMFDLRLEVHAPVNGSEAYNNGVPDEDFTITIAKESGEPMSIDKFFEVAEPELEKWDFSWYEDLFAQDVDKASVVNVASKIYRNLAIYEPGNYEVTLTYYGSETTTANWVVRPLATKKRAKNIILFIGDGMTTNMITAARLLGHSSVNGKYQSVLQMDEFPVVGHQMTHSIDSYLTDSANSASALYTGHKSTVNAMGVYVDSSADYFDDPKVETIVEILSRVWDSAWGAVSTAALSDATPTALTGHTRMRYEYGPLVDMALNGVTNFTSWTNQGGPDVYFGGGAEQFYPNEESYEGEDYYAKFAEAGYDISMNRTSLLELGNDKKALGVFCQSHMPVWLDRNVFPENLEGFENAPQGGSDPALDLPGLKDMTLKAIDILHKRGGDDGFFLMSEAASVDKQMHALDYDRALGDLLELDDTVRATVNHLKEMGELESTLILVTADHGHGFDVFGSADTKYLTETPGQREKRKAVGIYEQSGLSQYTVPVEGISYNTGPNFPVNWDPRYKIAAGFAANPDHRENYKRHAEPRTPAVNMPGFGEDEYFANPEEDLGGFVVNGTLPVENDQGVHSLTDVAIFAMGPCQEDFGGVYSNVDVFYKMASCLGLARADKEHGGGCAKKQ